MTFRLLNSNQSLQEEFDALEARPMWFMEEKLWTFEVFSQNLSQYYSELLFSKERSPWIIDFGNYKLKNENNH